MSSHELERDPELPGDGTWREPVFHHGSDGRPGPAPITGGPRYLRITPAGSEPWVATFAGGLHGLGAIVVTRRPTGSSWWSKASGTSSERTPPVLAPRSSGSSRSSSRRAA